MRKLVSLAVFIIFWHLMAIHIDLRILPSPVQVMEAIINNYENILVHTGHSLRRIFLGMSSAVILGVICGVALGYYKILDDIFSPYIYIFAPVPKISLLPLIMLFFGIGEFPTIFIIFLITVFLVVLAAMGAVKNIPRQYFAPLKTIKASDAYILKNIVFFAILPEVFTSIKIALATSISVLFFAETFGTRHGLGFYINDMWARFDYRQMYAGIVILGLIGYLLAALINAAEKIIIPWNFNGETND